MDKPACPEFAAALAALALLEHPSRLDAEARHCLAEGRRPAELKGLPGALADALRAARADAAARVLAQADAALWAAASRCQRGLEWLVGWQRIERELTAEERAVVAVCGRKGRKLQTAWRDAKRRRSLHGAGTPSHASPPASGDASGRHT